ncbi:Uncharacterized protein Rs2_36341 [Raphanus sativus]|nr:Uncharacterized protein Rs2_36341 [Raphanus sativus]
MVNTSAQVIRTGLKIVLEGVSKKTPPSSYVIPNPDAVVKQPQVCHHSRPLFPCFFPTASHTLEGPTLVHTTDLQPKFPVVVFRGEGERSMSYMAAVGATKIELIGKQCIYVYREKIAHPISSFCK